MATEPSSTKPYFLRAMHEWCLDNGFTPHLVVAVDARTLVPQGYVKDGEIVLNINYSATKDLVIGNEAITFSARFSGSPFNIYVPIEAVRGIFARENGQGMFFEPSAELPQDAADDHRCQHAGEGDMRRGKVEQHGQDAGQEQPAREPGALRPAQRHAPLGQRQQRERVEGLRLPVRQHLQ